MSKKTGITIYGLGVYRIDGFESSTPVRGFHDYFFNFTICIGEATYRWCLFMAGAATPDIGANRYLFSLKSTELLRLILPDTDIPDLAALSIQRNRLDVM